MEKHPVIPKLPTVPFPDLQIVPVARLHPHEEHDSQRSEPLIARLHREPFMINPPLVTPLEGNHYIVLDGANRVYALASIGYPHILVQVATYASGLVELDTWNHVIVNWPLESFLESCRDIGTAQLVDAGDDTTHIPCATIVNAAGDRWAFVAHDHTRHGRNTALRALVAAYQQRATLQRTIEHDPRTIWRQFPTAAAAILFQTYTPDDIIAAVRERAYLPPGITRHIVHGRALRVNYPLARLYAPDETTEDKQAELDQWLREKLASRQVRFYAEATYQFDE